MSSFLSLAYLFFIGSVSGWVLEVFFRKFFSGSNPEHKWINPGFCTGPYVPLYGCGLCALYLLGNSASHAGASGSVAGRIITVVIMAICMTLIEYAAGILLLKTAKVRLWDYSRRPGNINGLICPLFSLFWGLLGAAYYFLLHPHVLGAISWLADNLAFSFVIGFFFGVFVIDIAHSLQLTAKLKKFADDNQVIIKYENLKSHIRSAHDKASLRYSFIFPFRSSLDIGEHLANAKDSLESIKTKAINRVKENNSHKQDN
ncbi:MAG: putative ABC transporter permease [Firmicutes bacterium]|nr:putative ABC transporter permease [Bacillota bacterium]